MEPTQPISPVYSPSPSAPKKSNKKLILAIVVAVLIGGGIFAFTRSQNQESDVDQITPTEFPTPEVTEEPTPAESPTPEPTEKPSPTEKPEVTSAQTMNVQVLNGSGEIGVAGAARDHLSSKGYKYLETGNADNFDYQGVVIKIKSSFDKYRTSLQSALSDKYTIASDSGDLSEDSLFDAQVIVGK